jgi:hypothetical protein
MSVSLDLISLIDRCNIHDRKLGTDMWVYIPSEFGLVLE